MSEPRSTPSTGSTVFWFVLSVVVTVVNLSSASRGSWLALLLAVLSGWFAYRNGKILLARHRAAKPQRPT
ncbi:hypothetical protein [Pseudactinotalea sp.]|uniref:hypothetical protein n=1 Tax=Pseudactinotalea sp. TaxID=1926260 RepID=UPI003B3BBA9C